LIVCKSSRCPDAGDAAPRPGISFSASVAELPGAKALGHDQVELRPTEASATTWPADDRTRRIPVMSEREPPITSERRDGPTPNGGAYSIAYFLNRRGGPATKDRAAAVEIVEFSAAGEEIFRTYLERD
jgi:hypothetical protein